MRTHKQTSNIPYITPFSPLLHKP